MLLAFTTKPKMVFLFLWGEVILAPLIVLLFISDVLSRYWDIDSSYKSAIPLTLFAIAANTLLIKKLSILMSSGLIYLILFPAISWVVTLVILFMILHAESAVAIMYISYGLSTVLSVAMFSTSLSILEFIAHRKG